MNNSQGLNRISIGIDIVYIPRFLKFIAEENFKKFIFSEEEMSLPVQSLVGNFAIKEAFIKAFRECIAPFRLSDLKVLRNDNGLPMLRSSNESIFLLTEKVVSMSISHDIDYCVAVVMVN